MATGSVRAYLLVGMHDGVCKVACRTDGSAEVVGAVTPLEHAAARLAVCRTQPRVAYLAAYEAGLWRSDDGGGTWRRLERYPVEHAHSVAVHPQQPERLSVGSEPAAIYQSEDGGASWRECENFRLLPESKDWYFFEPRQPHVRALTLAAHDAACLYAGVEVGGVYRSTDAGASWRACLGTHPDVHSLSVTPARPRTLYAATARHPYRSDDGGDTWTEIGSGLPLPYIVPISPAPDDADLVLVACADSSRRRSSRLMRSTDGGRTWHEPDWPGSKRDMAVALAWDFSDSAVVYAGTDKGALYRSGDRGASWEKLPVSLGSVAVGSLAVVPR
ncbi:MAG: hypothetical protein HYY96_07420 [Candidatus Tectomicrobia bacterium]|nr:hypothetical protein [Candidatus Tectomicrobia bacterium]